MPGKKSKIGYQVFLNYRSTDHDLRLGFVDYLRRCLVKNGLRVFSEDDHYEEEEDDYEEEEMEEEDEEEDDQESKLDAMIRRAINDCRVYIPIFSKDYASSDGSCLQELEVIVWSDKSAVDKMILPVFFGVTADDILLDSQREEKSGSGSSVQRWKLEALEEVLKRDGQPWELKDTTDYVEFCEMVAKEVPIKCNAETVNRMIRLSPASGHTNMKEEKWFQTEPLQPSNIWSNPGAIGEKEKLIIPAEMQDYSYDVFLSFRRSDTRQEFVDAITNNMKEADICFFEDDPVLITEEDLERLSQAIDNSESCVPILSTMYASSFWCLLELEKMVRSGKNIIPVFYGVEQNDVVRVYRAALEAHGKNISSEIVQQWEKVIKRVAVMEGWEVKDEGAFQFSRYFAEHIFAKLPGTQQDQANEPAVLKEEEKYSTASGKDYEVFLSFRGKDTAARLLTGHLYDHLIDAGIRVFRNEEKLPIGDKINTISRVIKTSKICVPIISRAYTSSRWCMREIARMVEFEKGIVPIFYDVKPGDITLNVRHQEVFPIEQTRQWKDALRKVAKIKGWELKGQSSLVDLPLIAEDVLLSLRAEKRLAGSHLVGIHGDDGCLSDVLKLIDVEVPDVRLVAICGEDGIGKTTLAKVVYNQLSYCFDCRSFIGNVSTSYKGDEWSWLKELRAQLMLDLFGDRVTTGPEMGGLPMASKELLHGKKVLVVLDDVKDIDAYYQVRRLLELDTNWLALGSRVILTIRDSSSSDLLYGAILEKSEVYEMRELSDDQALQLFKLHGFDSNPPSNGHLNDLASKVVARVGNRPSAIEIVGSFLSSQSCSTWESTLGKLSNSREYFGLKLKRILDICYEELEDNAKQIFLDIACVFADQDKTNAFYMWEDCGLFPDKGIKALLGMSLIKVTENNRLWMHGSVRRFGREIAQNSANRAWGYGTYRECRSETMRISACVNGRTRQRRTEEEQNTYTAKLHGAKRVEALRLTGGEVEGEVFKGLQNLRFLAMNAVRCKGEPRMFHSNLKWLSWHTSEFEDFGAESLDVKYLVVLDLSRRYYYDVSSSGSGGDRRRLPYLKEPNGLKLLDLSGWRELTHIPDLYRFQSLERLVLEGCENLVKISISPGSLRSLKYLNIKRCYSLRGLPEELSSLTSLAEIVMKGNGSSFTVPEGIGKLRSLTVLEIANVRIGNLPKSIGKLQKLKKLSLFGCKGIWVLPESVGHLKSLVELDISYSDVTELPGSIGDLKELKQIKMEYCSVTYLPVTLGSMEKLEELCAKGCTQLTGEVPESIGKLYSLKMLDLSDSAINGIPETVNQLSSLGTLSLGMCNDLQELPDLPVSLTRLKFTSNRMRRIPDISKLHKLIDLVLSDFTDPKSYDAAEYTEHLKQQSASGNWLGLLPVLQNLNLNIRYITRFPSELGLFYHLKTLTLSCPDLNRCPQFPSSLSKLVLRFLKAGTELFPLSNMELLSHLEFDDCQIAEDLIVSLKIAEIASLECLCINRCSFRSLDRLHLPENLISLEMNHNKDLEELPQIEGLKKLRQLVILDSPHLSEVELKFSSLCELESLRIEGCKQLKNLINVVNLRELSIQNCNSIRGLENLGRLRQLRVDSCLDLVEIDGHEYLQELYVSGCHSLKRLDFSSWRQQLRVVKIENCVELMIDHLRDLDSLQELSISGCDSVRTLTFEQLKQLKVVKIDSCKGLKNIDGMRWVESLEELSISGCDSLERLEFSNSLERLRVVKIESRMDLELTNIRNLNSLQELSISGSVSLETSTSRQLKQLRVIRIDNYNGLTNENCLGELESLEELSISGCDSLEMLRISNSLEWLRAVKVERCKELAIIKLGNLRSLQELSISGCDSLVMLTFRQLKQLKAVNIHNCKGLENTDDLGVLESLEELSISGCDSLTVLDLWDLKSFKVLSIEGCKKLNGIAGLMALASLQELSIIGCESLQDLGDLSRLKDLIVVNIRGCENLEFVEGLHGLPFLEDFQISDCKSFKSNLAGLKPAKQSLLQIKRRNDFTTLRNVRFKPQLHRA